MTSGAPSWVSYTALGVAALAALVALISARISYLNYRASGPHIQLQAKRSSAEPGSIEMEFTVVNRGRGEVSIDGFYMTPYGTNTKPEVHIADYGGQPLPYRLAGNAQQVWQAGLLDAARKYDAGLRDGSIKPYSSWPELFYFSVKLGNGQFVHAKHPRLDARALIAEAFPND